MTAESIVSSLGSDAAIEGNGDYLVLDHLFKAFDERETDPAYAVKDVSLNVAAGEMVTLLGPSGCGKTTTLRMVAGFESPTAGSILMEGQDVTQKPANRRKIGMVFQSYALFPHLDVGSNVEYGLRVRGVPSAERRTRVESMLELVGLDGSASKMPSQLSGGQQQRVSLARAIVTEPHVLLFDEPLSNLDVNLRTYMREQIREIQQRVGITSIYVTHDRQEAMSVSDRIAVLRDGTLQQVGSGFEIYNQPQNRFVAEFMGSASFLDGVVVEKTGDSFGVRIEDSVASIRRNDVRADVGDVVTCVFRPESWAVNDAGSFTGEVLRSTFYGPCVEYSVQIAGQQVVVEDYEANEHGVTQVGDSISLSVKPGGVGALEKTGSGLVSR
ncbi:ABC transporter ATP-binding protein [Paramicrobacterium fandaimingii]|uniref:ABC transporter ATP-binding protein n=1 Tax=Paramicrobacterium fandaimingii TaxID=2708079 RepID=UPI001F381DCB|nr:ABC transporter ATP-binding protein [Microbacterium fandaimingii]